MTIAFVVAKDVAILVAVKAINAFDQLEIQLLENIENMAEFTVPETSQIYPILVR